jgi:hypothetical protein
LEEKDIEKTQIRIPSFKLSKSVLEELFGIMEKERTDEKSRLIYVLESTEREITSHNSKSFLDYGIPKDLEKLTFTLSSSDKEISISIELESYLTIPGIYSTPSYFTVSGIDPTWVNRITKRIEDIFKKYKTKNDLFHNSIVPAVLACIPLVFGVYFITFALLPGSILVAKIFTSALMALALGGVPFFWLCCIIPVAISFSRN